MWFQTPGARLLKAHTGRMASKPDEVVEEEDATELKFGKGDSI